MRGERRGLLGPQSSRGPWLLDLKAMGYDLGPLKPALEKAQPAQPHVTGVKGGKTGTQLGPE